MARDRISSLLRRRDWFEAFAKQELEGKWRPIPNLKWTIVFYAVLTIITIPLGGGIYHSTLKNSNFSTRYPLSEDLLSVRIVGDMTKEVIRQS